MFRFAPIFLAVACTSTAPDVVLTSISPDWAWSGQVESVRVVGENFVPAARASVSRDAADESGFFKLWLISATGEANRLNGVDFVGLEELTATVPAGLDEGLYDLKVETPLGKEATVEDLFRVSDSRASTLAIDVDIVHTILTPVTATIEVRDPAGETVPLDMEVEVRFRTDDGDVAPVEFTNASEFPTVLTDGVGRRGSLGDDGTATVVFEGQLPGEVLLEVEVVDGSGELQDVTASSERIRFDNGSQQRVVFDVEQGFEAVAGEDFLVVARVVDENDVLVPTVNQDLLVFDACSATSSVVEIRGGEGAFNFRNVVATGTTLCAVTHLVVADGLQGRSLDYTVLPAQPDHLNVTLTSDPVVEAGSGIAVTIEAADRFENQTDWDGSIDQVVSSAGPLQDLVCIPAKVSVCVATATVAASAMRVEVEASDGFSGFSEEFSVVAGPPSSVSVVLPPSLWVAGQPERVGVAALDLFGNVADADTIDEGNVTWSAEKDTPACELADAPGDQVREFDCIFTVADPDHALDVVVQEAAGPISATSGVLEVVNGVLANLELESDSAGVVAGETFALTARAFDAYGNAYVRRSSSVVTILDSSSTIQPDSLVLGPDGVVTTPVRLFQAGDIQLEAVARGLAQSNPVQVEVDAADAVGLTVRVDAPWVWVGENTEVRVESVDEWGNRAWAVPSAALSLESTSGVIQGSPVQANLGNGVATVQVAWVTGSADARLRATSLGLVGDSERIVVVSECGANGPTPQVSFDGLPYGVECLAGVPPSAPVVASMAGSTPAPGQTLGAYVLSVDGVDDVFSVNPNMTLTAYDRGVYAVQALAVQSDTCGASVETRVYVGEDGEPLGPIRLEPVRPSAPVGLTSSTLAIDIAGVQTCDGSPASWEEIVIRTDRGTLFGATPSGEGLQTFLDPFGNARISVDATALDVGGITTVSAWSPSGIAGGTVEVELLGDDQLPTVWDQSPRGAFDGTVDGLVTLSFSEPLDDATIQPGAFSIRDGQGAVGISSVTQVSPGVVEVETVGTFTGNVTPSWRVEIQPSVTDLAGNPLAGTWDGSASLYRGFFGGTAGVDPITACSVDQPSFRPDGDDGVGVHADTVEFSFSSAVAPVWWVMSVRSGTELVRVDYLLPSAASGRWVWDGRDGTGLIMPAGTYTVTMEAEGSEGDREGCERTVDIEHVEVP